MVPGGGNGSEIFYKTDIIKTFILQCAGGTGGKAGTTLKAGRVIYLYTVLILLYGIVGTGVEAGRASSTPFSAVLTEGAVPGYDFFDLSGIDGFEEAGQLVFGIYFVTLFGKIRPGSFEEKDGRGQEFSFFDGIEVNCTVCTGRYAFFAECAAGKIKEELLGQTVFWTYRAAITAVGTAAKINGLFDHEAELKTILAFSNLQLFGSGHLRMIALNKKGVNLQDAAVGINKILQGVSLGSKDSHP